MATPRLHRFSGDFETYGAGLRRIRSFCKEQNVPVEVSQRSGSVYVRFTRAEAVAADNPPTTGGGRAARCGFWNRGARVGALPEKSAPSARI